MALTGKELAQLHRLQKKAKEDLKPMTEDQLKLIEDRVEAAFNQCPEFVESLTCALNGITKRLQEYANDNAALIQEIRRLWSERDAAKGNGDG